MARRGGWPKGQEEDCPRSRLGPLVKNINSVPAAFEKILEMVFHVTCLFDPGSIQCVLVSEWKPIHLPEIHDKLKIFTSYCTQRDIACLKEEASGHVQGVHASLLQLLLSEPVSDCLLYGAKILIFTLWDKYRWTDKWFKCTVAVYSKCINKKHFPQVLYWGTGLHIGSVSPQWFIMFVKS